MKTTTTILRYLFVIVAAIAAAILPINILAAPGDLFVSDPYAGTISKFTPDGTKTTFASGLPYATGLAFDASGNLFVTEYGSGTISKFTPAGTKITFASGVTNAQGLALEPGITTPGAPLQNISARTRVLTGNNVLIGGFIISGSGNKDVLVRGLGPTLTDFGVTGALADPTLELHHTNAQGQDSVVATNDNWLDSQQAEIQATGKAPPHDSEAAILRSLAPGNYTAIVAGKNNTGGVGLVEMYD